MIDRKYPVFNLPARPARPVRFVINATVEREIGYRSAAKRA